MVTFVEVEEDDFLEARGSREKKCIEENAFDNQIDVDLSKQTMMVDSVKGRDVNLTLLIDTKDGLMQAIIPTTVDKVYIYVSPAQRMLATITEELADAAPPIHPYRVGDRVIIGDASHMMTEPFCTYMEAACWVVVDAKHETVDVATYHVTGDGNFFALELSNMPCENIFPWEDMEDEA